MSPAPLYTAAAAATRRGSRLARANGTMKRVALQASAPIVSTKARTRPTHTLYVGSDDWRAVVAVGGLFSVPTVQRSGVWIDCVERRPSAVYPRRARDLNSGCAFTLTMIRRKRPSGRQL